MTSEYRNLQGKGKKLKENTRHFYGHKDVSFKPRIIKLSYKQRSRKLQLRTIVLWPIWEEMFGKSHSCQIILQRNLLIDDTGISSFLSSRLPLLASTAYVSSRGGVKYRLYTWPKMTMKIFSAEVILICIFVNMLL